MISLREGNCGFGAVIVKEGHLIAKAHDEEKTAEDATAHAEITAIKKASAQLGRDLSECILVSTHEPCPMCATAMLWSGISELAYGCSIKEALAQGRKRIDLPCKVIYARAGKEIISHQDILKAECAVLYDSAVRDHIEQLRQADQNQLEKLAHELSAKRLKWFTDHRSIYSSAGQDILETAYRVFLDKIGITAAEAPIVRRDPKRLVLHSKNDCPTLEACNILGLDTRFVCRHLTEKPTTRLLRQIHSKLRFTRNYDRLRPQCDYCEEMIVLDD